MIIGHLPVGYFTTRYLIKKLKLPLNKFWLLLGLAGAIIPDLDYIYWILSNSQKQTHRGYFSGYPLFYLTFLLVFVIVNCFFKKKILSRGIIVVFCNIFIHFLLDTVFYGVKWFYPFYNRYIGIYNVGGYGGGLGIQVKSYFHHWYWYLEIGLWVLFAVSLFISYRKKELN
jgi:inner membrane protein